MKVTNALVTWDDLSTMGLTAKGTPPTGLGIANKAELIAAYYVDEAASPFSTYTSDRCPPYQTIQNTTTTTTTPPPTTTTTTTAGSSALLDWSVGAQSGGNLKVFSNTGTTLLDITSSAGGAQSGTLTIYSYQQPYTIRGSWISGSGNIIQYRVCDSTGEIYLSGNITASNTPENFTPSPVPLSASVALTAQNVTPPPCPA